MYTNTKIWSKSLEQQGDRYDHHRDRLRLAYFGFRTRVGELIQTISSDMPGLTVHDLNHLDALWEMADILTGENYELNPAEAFVLGGAILLHDSAMTVCAYSGGVAEIRSTAEYADALAHFQSTSTRNSLTATPDLSADAYGISETLRMKHASKAEALALQQWVSPIDGTENYLIEDSELRDHYACSIGRIAHSHHWNINDVPKLLGNTLGAFSGFPADWTIDQVKVALLLRCVDAMQIDDRRAPRFLASVRPISPESLEHWRFQNKLTQPHLQEGKLVYTSKSPFQVTEAAAWNLCFDTIQMIDQELRDSNDLHLQKNLSQFKAKGVAGAGSADSLAKYIEVTDWRPLPLNLKVSNVPHLARTLGGQDLYSNPLSPLRELIQNAADAIEARALVEEDFSIEDGSITVRFKEAEGETTLQIDDNGVGMSEHILTSALLDFGFSFWKSSTARVEFPGIQKNADRFRGRYGIGFFSIFMWSSEIIVCSRRFNAGIDETRVLEFRKGLESRPILRGAKGQEKSSKWTTRIQLKLKPNFLDTLIPDHSGKVYGRYIDQFSAIRRGRPSEFSNKSWVERIKLLCGALQINVSIDIRGQIEAVSLPSWRDCSATEFAKFFSGVLFESGSNNDRFLATLTSLSQPKPLGGRCYINPYDTNSHAVAVYEKGIFIQFAHIPNVLGIVESRTTNAARDRHSQISVSDDSLWLSSVRSKAFAICRHIGERISIQGLFSIMGELDPNQPAFIRNREFLSLNDLMSQVIQDRSFAIRLVEVEDNIFRWKPAEQLSTIVGLNVDEKRIHSLVNFKGDIAPTMDISEVALSSREPLPRFLRIICDVLGPSSSIHMVHNERDGYHNDYIDIVVAANEQE
ncbi:MAG: ATP-binding protein [Gammaproteobacteria bacterium]|nr:ATP-binding protein [Gammaproteobacteria bacterium]